MNGLNTRSALNEYAKSGKLAELAEMKRKLILLFHFLRSVFRYYLGYSRKDWSCRLRSAGLNTAFSYALPFAATWVLFVVGNHICSVYIDFCDMERQIWTHLLVSVRPLHICGSVIVSVFSASLSSYINVENLYLMWLLLSRLYILANILNQNQN